MILKVMIFKVLNIAKINIVKLILNRYSHLAFYSSITVPVRFQP